MDSIKTNAAVAISKGSIAPSVGLEATGNPANTLAGSWAHLINCVGDFIKNDFKWCILAEILRRAAKDYRESNRASAPTPSK